MYILRAILLFISVVVGGLFSKHALSAEITVLDERIQGYSVIAVVGELYLGDDERFETKALKIDKAIVFLSSPGGLSRVGVGIGKTIRLKKYITAVPPKGECASACGLVWLGGVQRLVYEPGRVGFHAAYNLEGGMTKESGVGNAIVGAYLSKLELTELAIEYLTESPPEKMTWLKPEFARVLGIDAEFIAENVDAATMPSTGNNSQSAPAPSAPPPEINSSPESSAKSFMTIMDRDIYGFDLGDPIETPAAVDCERSCAVSSACAAYTYVSEWRRCYLKINGDRVVWRSGAQSGYLAKLENSLRFTKVALHPSRDLSGEEIGYVLNSKTEDCITLCENNYQCTGFTFARKLEGRCSLKGGKLSLKNAKGMIAGVKTKR